MTDTTKESEWEPETVDIEDLERMPDRIQVAKGYTVINAGSERELRHALEEAAHMQSGYKDGARVVIEVHSSYDNMTHPVFTNETGRRDESFGISARELLNRAGSDLAGEIEDAYRDTSLGVFGTLPANAQDFYQVHIFSDKQR